MLRNEYGAIQQHLEPDHVRGLLVPIPDNGKSAEHIVTTAQKCTEARELLESLNDQMISEFALSIEAAIGKKDNKKTAGLA
jgi:type I restriction enzyme M protein